MLQLYHNEMSTCSQKIRLALAEKYLEWESVHIKLREGDQYDPSYLALNPHGVVPTLVHNGHPIIESQVILEYLEDAFPHPSLRPDDPVERAQMRLWTKQLDEGVHAATVTISVGIAFRHQFLQKSPQELDAYIEKIPDPVRQKGLWLFIQSGTSSPQFEAAIRRFDQLFSDMEAALAKRPWLAGTTYSLADISYTPYLTRFEHLHLFPMLDKRLHLQDWFARVKARESYRLAFTQWENPAYFEIYDTKARAEWPRVAAILKASRA